MTTWNPRANDLFLKALELRSPGERQGFLDGACAGDAAFRAEVEALIEAGDKAGSFLQFPAPRLGANIDAAAPPERPGTVIGPYKLLQQIGEGGMGTVFMAEQMHPVHRKVALKVIKRGMDSSQVIARFEAERQALAMMDHVNIARVLDAGTTEASRPYFVMELVHGKPITKYCDDHRLSPRERLELFVPVCHAIQHAHQKGIIHRDIKPSNVMITLYDGKPVPKVIDFGVAKATEQKLTERTLFTQYGAIVGTLEYMSPEQAEMSALGIDTRSDIYSLGVLLYELLTGGTPLPHQRLKEAAHAEVLRMIKEEEPPKPSTRLSDSGGALASISANRHMDPAQLTKLVRGDLDWIVMKCLEKDRNRRYETANGFALDVQRYLANEPVHACPPSAGYRLRKFVRRNRGAVLAAGLVLSAVIAGVIGTSISTALLLREKERTTAAFDRAEANLGLALKALDLIYVAEAGGHPEIRAGLPRDLLERGLGFYEEFARKNAHNQYAARLLGHAHHRAGMIFRELGQKERAEEALERAASTYREVLRLEPKHAGAHNNLGLVLFDKGDIDGAIASAREAVRLVPDDAGVNYNLGNALLEKGDLDRASTSFRAAIRLEPKYAEAHSNLGNALLAGGDADGAIASYREAIRLEPELVEPHVGLGSALDAKGDADRALASYREAIRLEPGLAAAHCNLSLVLLNQGDIDGAIASAREAVRLEPDLAEARSNLGNALTAKGDAEDSIAAFREAILLRPDNATSHNNLGLLLKEQGDADGAILEYGEAIRVDPDGFESHFNLGNALLDTGDIQGAVASYREAIRRQPDYAESHYALANALRKGEDPEGAVEAYREAIRIRPEYAEAHCNLGLTLRDQTRYSEALPWLRKGHELGSMRPDWDYPSWEWIETAERMAEMEGRFSGGEQPRGAVERVAFAELLYAKSRHAESARMYAEAFAEDAALAERNRYNAACSASLEAARGRPDAAEWRGRALVWLRAELAAGENAPSGLAAVLEHWKQDPDLAAVRDGLDDLPEPEREAWRSLWAAVERALAAAPPAAK